MELCTGQLAEAVIVARTHANFYQAPSSVLLRVPVISCTHVFTDSSYTAGVLALLSASILGVTEGETAYDQKCTWCGCEFTARLSKNGNFLVYVKGLYSCGDSVVKVSHAV